MTTEAHTFITKIAEVQNALVVPKTKNAQVPYKSRNAEEILDKVKPLLVERGLIITLDDDILNMDGRMFIRSTATITNGHEAVTGTGIAELLGTTSMTNAAQASGATGSYARKYALGAVLGIGDGDDADHTKYQPAPYMDAPARELSGAATPNQIGLIEAKRNGMKAGNPMAYEEFSAWYSTEFEGKPLKQLSKAEASKLIDKLNSTEEIF